MFIKKKSHIFILLVISCLIVSIAGIGQVEAQTDDDYFQAEVLSVEEVSDREGQITQRAEVLIESGPYAGEEKTIENIYREQDQYFNIRMEEGMEVILVSFEQDGETRFHLQDVNRQSGLLYLLGGFILILLLVGGFKGLKTLISLAFTAAIIGAFLLPLILAGYSPILLATISGIVIIIFILIVIGGWNVKSLAAIIGTSVGVVVAGVIAYYIGEISHLTGFSSREIQLLLGGDVDLDVRGLLYAGIIIGSLGAVTDVGMSVASAAEQVKRANPFIELSELIRSSFEVGRDIMGTMANTLILAYVGGATPFLLLILRSETHWLRIINMDYIATEIVRGVAGSIGLIVAIPVTAIVAGMLMNEKHYYRGEKE